MEIGFCNIWFIFCFSEDNLNVGRTGVPIVGGAPHSGFPLEPKVAGYDGGLHEVPAFCSKIYCGLLQQNVKLLS